MAKECCKEEKNAASNLVKATELPIHGNPHPRKDKVVTNEPSLLTLKIASMRQAIQPVLTPLGTFTDRVNHIVSTGVAHSQSTWQNVAESNRLKLGACYGTALLVTITRRGFFRKILYGSISFPIATSICYPQEAQEKSKVLWYILKNKLPAAINEQYNKLYDGVKKPESDKSKREGSE